MQKIIKSVSDKCFDGCCSKGWHHAGQSNSVYGLGLIGALVYFLPGSVTFTDYILNFLKALVWPAFLVYKLFTG